jgi:hypothetical protein
MNLDSSSDDKVSLRAKFRHATREAILNAAAGILGSDSAAQARMEDIAARAASPSERSTTTSRIAARW